MHWNGDWNTGAVGMIVAAPASRHALGLDRVTDTWVVR